jgi:D-3-phosphoglycerate dehydrogenase
MSQTSLPKSHVKIVLLEGIHQSAVDAFHADGYSSVEWHQEALQGQPLASAIRDAHIVGIRSATQLNRTALASAEKLIAAGCFCIGTNQVDLKAAELQGVPVFNAPFSNTRSVAELVLAEVVLLLRGIPARNAAAHRGVWSKTATGSREARGKTLGIVGYGHIGTQIGVLAESLGMNVIFYDIERKLALGNARQVDALADICSASDVVTCHVPETPATRNLINAKTIGTMRAGSCLINASRGQVVDIDALDAALASGHLAGAAIDVFPVEPSSAAEEFRSPLRGRDNVLLTPHIGGSTAEAQRDIGVEVATKLIRYSNNGSTLGAVNFPEVSLPAHPGQQRLLHIHHNRPGVLSLVNSALSDERINICGQYLQTTDSIGYVVIDIESPERAVSQELRRRLEGIDGTIRTRILF